MHGFSHTWSTLQIIKSVLHYDSASKPVGYVVACEIVADFFEKVFAITDCILKAK